MKDQNLKKITGIVLEAFPGATFKVKLEDGKEVLCQVAGKLRLYRIKILPGDRVSVEISPYDKDRGRITYRLR